MSRIDWRENWVVLLAVIVIVVLLAVWTFRSHFSGTPPQNAPPLQGVAPR
jgi:hypothetical protein